MPQTPDDLTGLKALVVIPKTVNYFYNQSGRRIADALASPAFRHGAGGGARAGGGPITAPAGRARLDALFAPEADA